MGSGWRKNIRCSLWHRPKAVRHYGSRKKRGGFFDEEKQVKGKRTKRTAR